MTQKMTQSVPGRHKEQRTHLEKIKREARKQKILPTAVNWKNTRKRQRKTRHKWSPYT